MNDNDTKASLPVNLVLGGGEYARIKTETRPRIGQENDLIAELTKFGWFLMSPGKEFDKNIMLLTQTSQTDFENLCRLDVLGLRDTPDHDQSSVFDEFKERLTRSPEGWYETTLPWKANHAEQGRKLKTAQEPQQETTTRRSDGSVRRNNPRTAS